METIVLDGTVEVQNNVYDLCDNKPKPDMIKSHIFSLGIPYRCPVKDNSTFCYKGNKVMTFSSATQRMIKFFASTRSVKFRINIKHDTGLSCFEGDARVVKINSHVK